MSVTPPRARSGPAKPHIPGLRRPQTRHSRASALVSRPHDGHRMEPVVLRNTRGFVVVGRLRHDAIALIEPDPEIDEAAAQRAERAIRIAVPGRRHAAARTGHTRHRIDRTGLLQKLSTYALRPR